jgi:hypothetical protein
MTPGDQPDPIGCPECGQPAPYHGFGCPESSPPRSLWGVHDIDLLFHSAGQTVVPFRGSSFAKAFDGEMVKSHLARQPSAAELEQVDPRKLLATQPGIQRAAVQYYPGSAYGRLGRPYAEPHSPGNKYPVIYRYTTPAAGRHECMILAGHHRSTAALLQARPVLARVIEGPVRAKGVRP